MIVCLVTLIILVGLATADFVTLPVAADFVRGAMTPCMSPRIILTRLSVLPGDLLWRGSLGIVQGVISIALVDEWWNQSNDDGYALCKHQQCFFTTKEHLSILSSLLLRYH